MQIEYGGAYFLDDGVQVVDASAQSLLHLGRTRARDGALQRKSDREEPLNDMVVQIAGDAIAVGQDVQLTHPALRYRQLPGQRRLIGERGHHVELLGGERTRAAAPQDHQHAGDRLGGAQGQHQRRSAGIETR